MFKNYIITAWKVFLKRKFFTFINLFGISLTLIVLLVAASIFDSFVSPNGPEKNGQYFVSIDRVTLQNDDASSDWSSSPGYKFLATHANRVTSAELISYFTQNNESAAYIDGKKITHQIRRTDANYWKILDFDFLTGRAFNEKEHNSGQYVAVISENLRDSYFNKADVLNSDIVVNNQRFKVIGVVKNVPKMENHASGDIWVPYKTSPSTAYKERFLGGWSAMLYSTSPNGIKQIQEEYVDIVKNKFISDDPEMFTVAISSADTKLEMLSREAANNSREFDSGIGKFIALITLLTLLFMLLPSINMININVSRIIERSTEIGIRKAFGASSRHLVTQFLVENIMLTAMGGIFGFAGAFIILQALSSSGIIPYADFSINLTIFIYGVLMIFLFGLLSGIYPAWKMSRLHPVLALKGEA